MATMADFTPIAPLSLIKRHKAGEVFSPIVDGNIFRVGLINNSGQLVNIKAGNYVWSLFVKPDIEWVAPDNYDEQLQAINATKQALISNIGGVHIDVSNEVFDYISTKQIGWASPYYGLNRWAIKNNKEYLLSSKGVQSGINYTSGTKHTTLCGSAGNQFTFKTQADAQKWIDINLQLDATPVVNIELKKENLRAYANKWENSCLRAQGAEFMSAAGNEADIAWAKLVEFGG